jgi:hypothetical protein
MGICETAFDPAPAFVKRAQGPEVSGLKAAEKVVQLGGDRLLRDVLVVVQEVELVADIHSLGVRVELGDRLRWPAGDNSADVELAS